MNDLDPRFGKVWKILDTFRISMCQVGAYGLAKQGWNFEQILKAYYSGIELTRLY